MSKKNKPKPVDPAQALAQLEQPTFKWKTVAQIAAAFAVLWVTALMLEPYLGYWPAGVVGVLSLVAVGFGIYVWRLTRRSREIVNIMQSAVDDSGRQRALEELSEASSKDAMKALARAQLLAQSEPNEAIAILEDINLKKAPAVLQDDVRSQLAMLYLRNNRVRDARQLADQIRLDRQPNPKAKALYAAVVAECFARTGKVEEARKLVETYDANNAEYGEAAAMLLRAQVFTHYAGKKRGLARKAMDRLASVEPNMLAGFLQKGTQPELMKMARQALSASGMAPKVKFKRMR